MEPKKYEEFITSPDILASGIQSLLDSEIRALLDPQMVVAQLIGKDTSLVNKPSGTKTFRKENSRLVAVSFNENADIPDICNATFTLINVTPTYYGGGCPITAQAILDFDQDLVRWSLTRLARAMAVAGDARIVEELLNVTLVTAEALALGSATYTLAHGEATTAGEAIMAVVTIALDPADAAKTWTFDYLRGKITFSGALIGNATITYIYSANREYVRTAVAGTISYDDIVNAKVDLRTEYVVPDGIVTDPLTIGGLLKDDKFIDASAFGEEVMRNGLIGKVAGMPIYSTDTMYDNVAVIAKWGPDFATVVYKETLKTAVQKMDKRPGDVWVQSWEKSEPVVIQPTWMRIIVGGQINAAIIP